jgi:peptidoglycan/LPS O-acetylase OafA/YrhL
MGEEYTNLIRNEKIEFNTNEYFQIDFLKAIMIFLVIFDHTVPWIYKNYMGVAFWERISIPIFLIIMGFNMGLSYQRTGERSLKKLYSRHYFKKKFWRYIWPFIILYIFSSLIGFLLEGFNAFNQYEDHFFPQHLFLGILPFWGPGNWFLPVIFISILIMPLLYKGFSGNFIWRITTLILCYLIELALYLFLYFTFYQDPFTSWDNYYTWLFVRLTIAITPFSMLSALGLGMWISRNPNIFAKQNILIWILTPFSLYYLIQNTFFDFRFPFMAGDYHLFVFPYSAMLVLITLKALPIKSNTTISKGIKYISKSTYHILLTQILYFAIIVSIYGDHYCASIVGINTVDYWVCLGYLFINWAICIPIGVLWWYLENLIRITRRNRRDLN